MKYLAIFALIGLICAVSAVPTKEELLTRAKKLEKALEAGIRRAKSLNPWEYVAIILETQLMNLKMMRADLEHEKLDPGKIADIGISLAVLERLVEAELADVEGKTVVPTAAPTVASVSNRPIINVLQLSILLFIVIL